MATSLRELLASTPLSGGNAPYVEALYEQFLQDPQSVEPAWRDYFQHLQDGLKQRGGAERLEIAGVREAIDVDDASRGLVDEMADRGGADETRSAGDEDFHAFSPDGMLAEKPGSAKVTTGR